ncbi:uncharacterized protein K489DRAFT_395082 [Dissoconium aciculare CBS 342.82]|uniref:Vps72/YL1 C-terminal domain-containing protein n=1 Tax=Dissoconium aciculare CBS 342.82 TaxID=1314786 RepID=A0A6J3M4R2_9PEZI|nr:uncharacterized protein K489DRAFT_395082 [Dissoconium aciculare CBS 342.82]KAF1822484.1 hypothetical protein K489DRAFT_395082 [Dissoconium aciculare CBS 342.82]
MSNDERSDSESERDDLSTTGLIATRAKRSTAGNLYATLRQNLDDEELQNELLAEDEEDVGDYEGSDQGDDDEAMDSSSDEGDGGPPKDGDQDDLDGEKELKRAERAEAKKIKRMQAARMRIPAWQRSNKRVKLADDAKTEDGASARPKKKADRAGWLPADFDGPTRQSSRASAVHNREMTNASLKESAARSEKQKTQSQKSQEREQLKRRVDLTKEERMAKAMRVEKETAREFGRWEREEAERQRIRDEQLAAKRKRGIEGPIHKFWSGSVLWAGDQIKIGRMHGHQQGIDETPDKLEGEHAHNTDDAMMVDITETPAPTETTPATAPVAGEGVIPHVNTITASASATDDFSAVVPTQIQAEPTPVESTDLKKENVAPLAADAHSSDLDKQQPQTLLDGVHAYASQQSGSESLPTKIEDSSSQSLAAPPQLYTPSFPILHGDAIHWSTGSFDETGPPPDPQHNSARNSNPSMPTVPSEPVIEEQAQRSLLILEQFSHLENPITTIRRSTAKAGKETFVGPTPLASTLAPIAYPEFTSEELRYLTAKMRKRGAEQLLPPAPTKTRCALTSWPAKFKDPKTGLPYADLQSYKLIQRILAGGCSWSSLLGAWVGPAYGDMGRPARGVPSGFSPSPVDKKAASATSIKHESAE